MLDFGELPGDGQAFEQLVRELLFSHGLHVQWSGRGPDGGRDLICRETLNGLFAAETRTWLVQCKHFAHSGRSVGTADLDDIVGSCIQHQATGYLLVCSTQPSSAVVQRLEAITANPSNIITATYWDAVTLERLLSVPRQWAIAQRFLPASSGDWLIYSTERPNDFVVHYRGYVFHLSNRIGSRTDHHLPSIQMRIEEIEAIPLPNGHFIRPRAVWYNDKHGVYTWYVDYMYPRTESPAVSRPALAYILHDGWGLEDGQVYYWDIKLVQYFPYSDHYDHDHYDYYVRNLSNFLDGSKRETNKWQEYYAARQEIASLEKEAERKRHVAFKAMLDAFNKVTFVRVVQGINVCIEDVHKFERRFAWSDVARDSNINVQHLFTALVTLEVTDEENLRDMLGRLPNSANQHFRAARVYVCFPEHVCDDAGSAIYDLTLSISPSLMGNQVSTRNAFDMYFNAIRQVIENFASENIER